MVALRALNAPMGVWFSCLSHTSVPNAAATCGHTYCGVGGTSGRSVSAADSIAVRSGSTAGGSAGAWLLAGMAFMVAGNIRDTASTVAVQLSASIPATGPLLYMSLQTK